MNIWLTNLKTYDIQYTLKYLNTQKYPEMPKVKKIPENTRS